MSSVTSGSKARLEKRLLMHASRRAPPTDEKKGATLGIAPAMAIHSRPRFSKNSNAYCGGVNLKIMPQPL